MNEKYYVIRFERDDGLHEAGAHVMNRDNLLRIGQTTTCEIQLANNSQYEDAVLAIIEKLPDDAGWKLIRISPFKEHEVRVNGTPIDYVHFLCDGDRIAFEGQRQELLFNVRDDGLYTAGGIMTVEKHSSKRLIAWLVALTLVLSCLGSYYLYDKSMNARIIDRAGQSVFKIQVDSVRLDITQDSQLISRRTEKVEGVFGTAFLTKDGMLVTARHCIEPWLNIHETTLTDPVQLSQAPAYVKIALEAVTRNIMTESGCDSVTCSVTTIVSIMKPERFGDKVELLHLTSDQFLINNTRDEIMQFGDFSHEYFWRSITVRPRRIDMMLGDIACIPNAFTMLPDTLQSQCKGTIRLASKDELKKICQQRDIDIVVMGRTTTNTGNKEIDNHQGKMVGTRDDEHFTEEGYLNVVLSHQIDIKPGFSGGPILTRCGLFSWRAIGVVSVKDTYDEERFYSVPVTEIERMMTLYEKERTTKP